MSGLNNGTNSTMTGPMRTDRETEMGKHEAKETVFKWEPRYDDFYKERINTLEKENARLKERISLLEQAAGNAELAMEHQEMVSVGISNELNMTIEEKEEEITKLKGQIKMLKEAVVNGALREVLA